MPAGSGDNYACFRAIGWQDHVYGAVAPELDAWCRSNSLALHAFEWRETYASLGLVRDAMYLVRPDAHVALAAKKPRAGSLEDYFRVHGFTLPGHQM